MKEIVAEEDYDYYYERAMRISQLNQRAHTHTQHIFHRMVYDRETRECPHPSLHQQQIIRV